MVLFGNGGIPTTFRYKLSGFSGARREKSKIGDSCGNSEFLTATGGRSPPNLEDLFSTPTEDKVLASVSVSSTDHSETLLTVVVKTSTGGPVSWFGIRSSVLDAPTTSATTGIFTSLSW